MNSYSQNFEDQFVLSYFKGFKGTLLEIGANDGRTLSNSLLLIENGWKAQLIEPGSINTELVSLHQDNHNVECHGFAISSENGNVILHESGSHIKNGTDWGLVSSLIPTETDKWRNAGVGFIEHQVQSLTFKDFWNYIGNFKFDFISIDTEGLDFEILQQIDLKEVGCKCLCIEWNSKPELQKQFNDYILPYELKLIHINRENLIYAL